MKKVINEIKTFEERKKELLEIGKQENKITYEVLASHLKGLELTSEELDELYNLFNENGIKIVSGDDDDDDEESGQLLLDDNI